MEYVNPDILCDIALDMPDESIVVLGINSPNLLGITEDSLFWMQKTELLLKTEMSFKEVLSNRTHFDWKEVYNVLKRVWHDKEDPFINTIKSGSIDAVNILLEVGYNPNNSDIITASTFGHLNILQLLLTYPNVNPGVRDNAAIKGAIYTFVYKGAHLSTSSLNKYKKKYLKGTNPIINIRLNTLPVIEFLLNHPSVNPNAAVHYVRSLIIIEIDNNRLLLKHNRAGTDKLTKTQINNEVLLKDEFRVRMNLFIQVLQILLILKSNIPITSDNLDLVQEYIKIAKENQ